MDNEIVEDVTIMVKGSKKTGAPAPRLMHADAVPEARKVIYTGGKSAVPYAGLGLFEKNVPTDVPADVIHLFMHTSDFVVLVEEIENTETDGED